MTRTAHDQAMLDDAERHANGTHDHHCEQCGKWMPCDKVECHYVSYELCKECNANDD